MKSTKKTLDFFFFLTNKKENNFHLSPLPRSLASVWLQAEETVAENEEKKERKMRPIACGAPSYV
jgi:predicted transcriptional regulator